jgi:hypothetical protein
VTVCVGVYVVVGVRVNRRATAVLSMVGEAATVGVWGASISMLHPANASSPATIHTRMTGLDFIRLL